MNVFYVYLLKCWKDKDAMERERPLYGHIIYTGQTNNIFRRLVEHIKGKSGYTKQFNGNIALGCIEAYDTRKEAMNREDEIKTFSRDKKVELIQTFKRENANKLGFIIKKVKEKLL